MIDYDEKLRTFDTTNQFQTLLDFPIHFREGIRIGMNAPLPAFDATRIQNIVLCGMGGSAIGADILRTYLASELPVPVTVNRTYGLPAFAGPGSLVVVISYSGNTEESLSAYEDAVRNGAQVAAITSGGTIAERAASNGSAVILVPGGLAPRYALGYLFPPLLCFFARIGLIPSPEDDLNDALLSAETVVRMYSTYSNEGNQAVRIAESLHGTLPVIYSPQTALEAVNLRWRNQISENSKMLAFGNVFPEMNHNEIVGWEQNTDLLKRIAVLALHEAGEEPKITKRMQVTLDLIRPYAAHITEIHADEERLLSRIIGLICLGDWISFYLAIGTDTDPFPIEKINTLKNALADN